MLSRRIVLLAPFVPVSRAQKPEADMFGDAEAYERFMGRWSRMVAPLLVDFAGFPDQGGVLDVGSGTGALAFAIAARKSRVRVLGIDPSKEYVAYAASKNSFHDRAKFETGDAQQMRFGDATFDAALSLLVFNFIPDAKKALAETRRVTRPGGSISAAVWDYGGRMEMLRAFWDAAGRLDSQAERLDEKHMPLCREGELAHLWKEGGLEKVQERPIDIEMRFASFADYWEPFLLGQGPAGSYVRHLDRNRLEALRSEVKRRLKVAREEAPLALPARVWAVTGTVPGRR